MTWDPNLWTVPLLLAGVLTSALAWVTWEHRTVPGLRHLCLFLGAISLWILAYLGELLAADLSLMIWFARVEYIGIVAIGPLWLAFALAYTGRDYMITRPRAGFALAISLSTLVLAWTTSWHGLIWREIGVQQTAAGSAISPEYGGWFWVNLGFQYGCLSLATLLLLWSLVGKASAFRAQGMALVLASIAPWLGNLAYVSGWEAADGIDLSVYGLAVAGVVFGWGILARTLVEIVPVAREMVVETSSDAVLVLDQEGRIVDANPSAVEILEGPVPLLRARADQALAHQGLDLLALPLGRTLLELTVGVPGRLRIFDCRTSDLAQPGGRGQGRVVALRDVTEAEMNRRALEEGREALEAQLRQAQKMETVGTLAGGIAHDFNNILASIRGHAELAYADLPQGSPILSDLNEVIQSTDRARNLVRQILTFSRRAPEARHHVDLQGVVGEVMESLQDSVPQSISFETRLDPTTSKVFADEAQLHQVVVNLCSNAVDALEGAREPRVSIVVDEAVPELGRLPEELTKDSGESWVRLVVRDNGTGMDEKTRGRIFDPFFTTKEVGRGTGLGLAVVHGIVVSNGGWIDVASKPGQGAEITVFLPPAKKQVPEPAGPEGEGEGTTTMTPRRVLVVDDEASVRLICQRFLEGMGHQVRVAGDRQEAKDLFDDAPLWPDLMVLDQTMPGGTGLAFAKEVRAAGFAGPILMMTGFEDSLPSDELEAAGAGVVLPKPFSRMELAAALRSLASAIPA